MASDSGSRKRHALAALLVAGAVAALCLTYNVILLHPREIAGRYDVARYFGPLSFYFDHSIHEGHFPLWNPMTFCGMPFAANPQALAFYPPNVARSLLNFSPTPYSTQASLTLMIGLHLLLAFLGAYALARAHALSRPGSVTAAVVFTFSALMVRRAAEYHFVTVLGWLPLLLLLLKLALDAPVPRRKLQFALGAGIVFGISILGGFMQIVNYMAITAAVYGVAYRFTSSPVFPKLGLASILETKGGEKIPVLEKPGYWLDAAAGILVVVVGGLIAAAILLPASELAAFTARQKGETIGLYSDWLKKSPLYIWQSIVVYPGVKWEAVAIRGAGAIALSLSLVGLMHIRRRAALLFGVMYLVLLDCSFGPPFPISTIVNWLTPFALSVYSRAYDVALLPLAMLAGIGVDALAAPVASRNWRGIRMGAVAGIGAVISIGLIMWAGSQHYLHPNPLVLLVPLTGIAMIAAASWLGASKAMCVLLPIFVLLETFAWNVQYVPFMVGKKAARAKPLVINETAAVENAREMDPVPNRLLFNLAPAINGYDPLHLVKTREIVSAEGRRGKEYHRIVEAREAADNTRENLLLKRPFWLTREYVRGPLPGKSALFPPAAAVFLQQPPAGISLPEKKSNEAGVSVPDESAVRVDFANPQEWKASVAGNKPITRVLTYALPRRMHAALRLQYTATGHGRMDVSFVDSQSHATVPGRSVAVVPTGTSSAMVEIPAPDYLSCAAQLTIALKPGCTLNFTDGYVACDGADEDNLIKITSWKPNAVEIETGELPGPRVLVFTDAAYPGWRVWVDSAQAPLLLADDGFKAVALAPGQHAVRFAFSSPRVTAGVTVSLIATIAAAAMLLLLARNPLSRSLAESVPYVP